jgi:hypothetical protein
MHRKPIRSLVLAIMLSSAPVALAHGGAADRDDAFAGQAPAVAPQTDRLPSGAATLPPDMPAASSQSSGIGNISDTPGSMSEGAPAAASRQAPASAEHMPPVLPRGTQPSGGIRNTEDVTGSMGDGSPSGR